MTVYILQPNTAYHCHETTTIFLLHLGSPSGPHDIQGRQGEERHQG